MIEALIIIIGIPIMLLIIIYKAGQWDNFMKFLDFIFKKKTTKPQQKMQYNYCVQCGKKLHTCPYCNTTYCEHCKISIEL